MDDYYSDSRVWAKCLVFSCPLEIEISSCVFKEIRKLAVSQKIEFIDKLSSEELSKILAEHKDCFKSRESKLD